MAITTTWGVVTLAGMFGILGGIGGIISGVVMGAAGGALGGVVVCIGLRVIEQMTGRPTQITRNDYMGMCAIFALVAVAAWLRHWF